MFTVYILKSKVQDRYYVGCSSNIGRRLREHNNKKVQSTKAFVPWILVYKETFENKDAAYNREKQIKSYKSGSAFQKLLQMESWQSG